MIQQVSTLLSDRRKTIAVVRAIERPGDQPTLFTDIKTPDFVLRRGRAFSFLQSYELLSYQPTWSSRPDSAELSFRIASDTR